MFIRIARKLLSNNSGNIGIIFALMALPVVFLIGGAIDILRITNSSAKLQAAVEAGVLSAASLTSDMSVEDAVNEYISANLGSDKSITKVKVTIENEVLSFNKRLVEVKAEAIVPLTMFHFLGDSIKKISVTAEAVEARQTMELAMVLDISSSMRGNRLKNLKVAASSFVDQILTPDAANLTSINLVPFGGTVNIGDMFDDYVVENSKATINPSASAYTKAYDITEKKFRFTDSDKCIELTREDFDLDEIPGKSRPQVPHFWKWNNFNPWCPKSTSAVLLNTNDAGALKKRITEMTLSDGTGMDHGILWGAKSLSPSFRGKMGGDFESRPNDFDNPEEEVQKIMVLMTDGGITFQGRPKDYSFLSTHTKNKNNKNQQTLLSRGNANHTSKSNSAIGNYKAICDDLQEKGVVIYTIGFQIKKNSLPEKMLQYCATNPANYYLVESLDISKAFNAIAVSVQKLRVSG